MGKLSPEIITSDKAEHIVSLYSASRLYYKPQREDWAKSYKQYKSYLDVDSMKDYYKWRSHLFIPATAKAVDGLLPDLLLALFSPNPFFNIKPREANDVEQAKLLEALLAYQFEECSFFYKFYEFLKQMALYGTTFGKVFWKKETEKYDTEIVIADPLTGDPSVKKIAAEKVSYDAPYFEPLDVFSVSVSPKATSLSDTWVVQRAEKTIGEMKRQGIYKNVDQLEQVILSDKQTGRYEEEQRKTLRGLTAPYSREEGDERRVELLEYWSADRKKTMTIAGQRVVVRPERDNPLGIDPFVDCGLWGNPFELFGTGVPEKVRDLQDQLNCEVNQRLDNRNLRQNFIIKVRRGANVNTKNLLSRPGAVWLTDDMTAIDVMNIPDISSSTSFAEENMLEAKCEEITGVTRYSTGSGADSRRTATEVSVLTKMASKAFALHLQVIEEKALKPILLKFVELNKKFMEKDKAIRIIGPEGEKFITVPTEGVRNSGDFDYIPQGSSQLVDRNLMVQQMINYLGIVKDDPMINRSEIHKRVWEAWGNKDFNLLLQPTAPMAPGMPTAGGAMAGVPQGPANVPMPPTGIRLPSPVEGASPLIMGGGGQAMPGM